mgnify:FL=1
MTNPTKTVTLRIPVPKHERLVTLAKVRGISVNKLLDELATVALANHDAEARFRIRAARGSVERGLELLNRLDRGLKPST